MCTPAKRLARVSCSARATARPPTPSAVSSGAMEMPRVCSTTRQPMASTTTRVMLTKMVADPATPDRDCARDCTSPATTRAAVSVATRMSSGGQRLVDVAPDPAWSAAAPRPPTAAPPVTAAQGARVRSASTMMSSPLHRVLRPVLAQPAQDHAQQQAGRDARGQRDAGDDHVVQGEVPVHRVSSRRTGKSADGGCCRREPDVMCRHLAVCSILGCAVTSRHADRVRRDRPSCRIRSSAPRLAPPRLSSMPTRSSSVSARRRIALVPGVLRRPAPLRTPPL